MRTVALALLFASALIGQRGGYHGGAIRAAPAPVPRHGGFISGGVGHRPGVAPHRGFVTRSPGFPGRGFSDYGWRNYRHVTPYARYGAPYSAYGSYGFSSFGGWWPGYSYYSYPYWGTSAIYQPAPSSVYYAEPVVVSIPPVSSSPVVIINQHERVPAFPQAEPRPPEEPAASAAEESRSTWSPIYLVAAKDGTIWAAIAYWVDGSTLHFTDTRRQQRRIRVSDVDRELTDKLGEQSRARVRLP
jgi:hypothetical protein